MRGLHEGDWFVKKPFFSFHSFVCFKPLSHDKTDPEKEFPETLPRHMSARVSTCTNLAATIKELGYRHDLGYHQLLYPNETDTRDCIMFLAKNVPEEAATDAAVDSGASRGDAMSQRMIVKQRLGQELATAVRTKLSTISGAEERARQAAFVAAHAWEVRTAALTVPCRSARLLEAHPGLALYYGEHVAPVGAQPARREDLAASVFEREALGALAARDREQEHQATLDSGLNPAQYKETRRQGIETMMAATFRTALSAAAASSAAVGGAASRDSLADLLANYGQGGSGDKDSGSRFARQVKYEQEDTTGVPVETAEERFAKLERELEERLAVLRALQGDAGALADGMQAFDAKERQLEADSAAEDARLAALEDEYRVKKRTYDLLPNAEDNIQTLTEIVDKTSARLVALAAEWEKHRAPLLEELRNVQDLQDAAMGESRVKLERIKAMRDEIKRLIDEIKQRDERYKQLVEAYRAMKNTQNRAIYTRRILDIVRNVKKQKIDIARILEDTRSMQKEINGIREHLARIYAVADEKIYQDAKRDQEKGVRDTSKKDIYKQVVDLNKGFEDLIATIEEIGQTRATILNLESKIEQVQARTSAQNMERIQEDLRQIREANAALTERIHKLM